MNYIQRLSATDFRWRRYRSCSPFQRTERFWTMLRQQKEKIKWEQQERALILNELQTHISVFERTGDMMTYQKGYRIEVKDSPPP